MKPGLSSPSVCLWCNKPAVFIKLLINRISLNECEPALPPDHEPVGGSPPPSLPQIPGESAPASPEQSHRDAEVSERQSGAAEALWPREASLWSVWGGSSGSQPPLPPRPSPSGIPRPAPWPHQAGAQCQSQPRASWDSWPASSEDRASRGSWLQPPGAGSGGWRSPWRSPVPRAPSWPLPQLLAAGQRAQWPLQQTPETRESWPGPSGAKSGWPGPEQGQGARGDHHRQDHHR